MQAADSLRITTLVDNHAGQIALMAEHGSSMLIESGNSSVMLDCGQTGLVLRNARNLGVDLDRVQSIVLSHGHYDHTGGLRPVLRYLKERGKRVRVYAHPAVFEHKYSLESRRPHEKERLRFTGMRLKPDHVRELGGDLVLSTEPVEIAPGVWTSGEIPRDHGPEAVEKKFLVRRDSGLCQDHIPDDQFIWAAVPGGIAVICGCCHAGLENSLHCASRLSGGARLRLVAGGLHLLRRSDEELFSLTKALKDNAPAPDLFLIGHCTGFKAILAFNNAFPGRVAMNAAGARVEVGREIVVR